MNLTEEQVLKITDRFLNDKAYNSLMLGNPYFEPFDSKRNVETIDCWIIPMILKNSGKEEASYLYIEDKTGNVMYLLTNRGREFLNR